MKKIPGLILALVLVVAACGDDDGPTTTTVPATTAAPTTATAPPVVITIEDFAFGDPVTVQVGQTVSVRNADGVTHTWTARDGVFDSDNIRGGDEFTFVFDAPGEHAFFCEIHPSMTGTITVEG